MNSFSDPSMPDLAGRLRFSFQGSRPVFSPIPAMPSLLRPVPTQNEPFRAGRRGVTPSISSMIRAILRALHSQSGSGGLYECLETAVIRDLAVLRSPLRPFLRCSDNLKV